ncbi:hypothetical protein scyTo_0025370, partial [Scyliorhinus torazame]|nr:hypothetical protein [Scyliorhinus torazame]
VKKRSNVIPGLHFEAEGAAYDVRLKNMVRFRKRDCAAFVSWRDW